MWYRQDWPHLEQVNLKTEIKGRTTWRVEDSYEPIDSAKPLRILSRKMQVEQFENNELMVENKGD